MYCIQNVLIDPLIMFAVIMEISKYVEYQWTLFSKKTIKEYEIDGSRLVRDNTKTSLVLNINDAMHAAHYLV